MHYRVIPVIVSYHTPRWVKIALRSFWRHFPAEQVLVIDNNPHSGEPGWEPACDEERRWLERCSHVILVANPGLERRHGAAIDRALEVCRQQGAELMLLFEPDCHILGRAWYELLLRPMTRGAWMSGMMRLAYGPLHPCPSLWRVDHNWASFLDQPRGNDACHPRFNELFFFDRLLSWVESYDPPALPWWRQNWDTAQKNWFHAAVHDKAVHVPHSGDFRHFWSGSQVHRDHPEFITNPQLAELLA
jgi:hypothetical protein